MKYTRNELERTNGSININEDVQIDDSVFESTVLIQGVKDVHVDGIGYMGDDSDTFECDLHITCTMLCPDAITDDIIEVPLDTVSHEIYSFVDSSEDGVRVVKDEVIDFLPAVVGAILLEVPISVTEASEEDYPSGDGWRVLSEAEYQKSLKDRIDPRLAKLKEFKGE